MTTEYLKLHVPKMEALILLLLLWSVILSLFPSQRIPPRFIQFASFKNLGIILDSTLSYNSIPNLAAKLAISTFKNISYHFHPRTVVQKTMISHLDYSRDFQTEFCSSALTNLQHTYFPHGSQHYPLIYKSDYCHHTQFSTCLTFHFRIKPKIFLVTYKARKHLTPDYLVSYHLYLQ